MVANFSVLNHSKNSEVAYVLIHLDWWVGDIARLPTTILPFPSTQKLTLQSLLQKKVAVSFSVFPLYRLYDQIAVKKAYTMQLADY